MKTVHPATTEAKPLVTTVAGAAKMLSCGREKIYTEIRAGRLGSYLDGDARRITVRSIENYIEDRLVASRQRGFERRQYPGSARPPPD
jgi:excisionase family DNA binding protein